MNILYRPMVKEALVLITSGVLATMICSRVYAAPIGDTEQAAPTVTMTASAQTQAMLGAPPADQAREMLLAAIRGQTPLAGGVPSPR